MALIALAGGLLCGCAAGPEWGWKRTDGRSARNDPELMREFEHDKTSCVGEIQQAGLVGAAGGRGSGGGTMRGLRDQEAKDVVREASYLRALRSARERCLAA